ncbi:MAG: glycosyltransferase family 2 protein [Fimbriimonadaceae bacterium]|nr:glycosyltransferase family 2 protein [Fimbriimonadaceae bacterium]
MPRPDVSIAIPTRNRANSLARTLSNLTSVEIPTAMRVQVVVVDNGSTDHTGEVVRNAVGPWGITQLFRQPYAGVSRARNCAIHQTDSPILLFLDDDVRPDSDWLVRMMHEFEDPNIMVLGGGIELDSEICPDWMEPWHHTLFASTAFPSLTGDSPRSANIGFRRDCFRNEVSFDPEIGAGTDYGFAEEYLLLKGLRQNGYIVKLERSVRVVHEFDPSRLSAESIIKMAEGSGRSGAYATYHYGQALPRLLDLRERILRLQAHAVKKNLSATGRRPTQEEFNVIQRASSFAQFRIERNRPPNYEFPDQRKLRGILE